MVRRNYMKSKYTNKHNIVWGAITLLGFAIALLLYMLTR